jgi:FMN-dependent oxidoreductase (nitrilotriacetate monooxygenase family)
MTKQMKILAFPLYTGTHVAGWRHPDAAPGRQHDIAFHVHHAQVCERARLDGIFFADSQGFRRIVGKTAHSRMDAPRLEPLTLLGALSMVTTHLGLIGTLSTSYNEPYSAARRLATLDHISGGRAGWNVVTSTSENEAHNFGRDSHFGHAERYERAHEFVDVAKALWDSWDDDAVIADPASGRYFDPDKVHGLNHEGRFFKVAGPSTVGRPPQGHSVIVQAGASGAGQALAARHADVVFSSHPELDSAVRFYQGLKAQVAAAGRDPDQCKILSSIHPVVASTEPEAKAIVGQLTELIHPDLALSMLQSALGDVVDLTGCDMDGPLPDIPPTNASQSIQDKVIQMARQGDLTILQVARRVAAGQMSRHMIGSGEQVAGMMQEWFAAGACDGFVVSAPYLPGSLEAFTAHVVPVLQARGLFRTEYEGSTLRENLGLARPPSRYAERPELHIEPEIW